MGKISNILAKLRQDRVLKTIDIWKEPPKLMSSRKKVGSTDRIHQVALGSDCGGTMTIIAILMIIFLLIFQLNDMYSGSKDIINSVVHNNNFLAPNNQVLINNTNFMPSFAIHI